jgi:ribA/ribD-fused uncharacterized protein
MYYLLIIKMETDKYIFFCGHAPNKVGNIFSQWYPAQFQEKFDPCTVITFDNCEQYMMAHKALLFGDGAVFEKIMKNSDPGTIKKLGRQISSFNSKVWDEHKFDIVANGNRLKFGQNPALRTKLLATHDKMIVEAAHYDKIWGIGLSAENAVKIPENEWPGENLLGKVLMLVRSEYK